MVYVSLFLRVEKLRKATDLLVSLLAQTIFNDFVNEVIDSFKVFVFELHSLLVEGKTLMRFNSNFNLHSFICDTDNLELITNRKKDLIICCEYLLYLGWRKDEFRVCHILDENSLEISSEASEDSEAVFLVSSAKISLIYENVP